MMGVWLLLRPHLDPTATSQTRVPCQSICVVLTLLAMIHIICHSGFYSLIVNLVQHAEGDDLGV